MAGRLRADLPSWAALLAVAGDVVVRHLSPSRVPSLVTCGDSGRGEEVTRQVAHLLEEQRTQLQLAVRTCQQLPAAVCDLNDAPPTAEYSYTLIAGGVLGWVLLALVGVLRRWQRRVREEVRRPAHSRF